MFREKASLVCWKAFTDSIIKFQKCIYLRSENTVVNIDSPITKDVLEKCSPCKKNSTT